MPERDDIVPINIFIGMDAAEVVADAVQSISIEQGLADAALLLPSTGNADDALAALLRSTLIARGILPSAVVEPNAWSVVIGNARWQDVDISPPDLPTRRVKISQQLADSDVWIVCDVDTVAETGPFVLDVVSRYLHPLDRLRQLADRERSARSVETNLAVRASWCIVAGHVATGYCVAVTRDLIAAELFVLARSEHALGPTVSTTGPWEDPMVQRATEIGLGVLVPHRIAFVAHGDHQGTVAELHQIADRIGVAYPGPSYASMSAYVRTNKAT